MTLFSSYMTGGLYARYTSSASGSDEARVAKFDVAHSDQSFPMGVELDFFDSSKRKLLLNLTWFPTARLR
jgi:hypothetical protein